MDDYLNGDKLYGDDFSLEQIKKWYEEESEGYANLGNRDEKSYTYHYNAMNTVHGFDKIKDVSCFENVLGFGAAWGHEFEPILNKIKNLTIIEPSNNLKSNKIGNLVPTYVKPNINGDIYFEDNLFDLITCFGALHHVPNVSHILQELIRILKPNGYLLLREPIVNMGDWRYSRKGLTKNERGIPLQFFSNELSKYPIKIVSEHLCFSATSFIERTIGKLFKKPIFSYKVYVLFDKLVSRFLKFNINYHPKKIIDKISPSSIFYVIKKISADNL